MKATIRLSPRHLKSLCWIIALCFAVMSPLVQASDASSAYLGLGFETVNYSETLDLLGQTLKTHATVTNLVQRSGSYVAIDNDKGFYINTSSSLLAGETNEAWNYGSFGPIQQNRITAERQTLDMLGNYRFGSHHGILAGLRYQKLLFNRYDFKAASGTTNFQNATGASLNINSTYAVSETATSFSLGIGYGYNDFFVDTSSGLKWNAQLLLSLPFFSKVANTSVPDLSFSRSFSGYDLGGHIALGWQLGKNVIVAASLEGVYSRRNKVTEQNSTLPKNTLIAIQPALTAHWSF